MKSKISNNQVQIFAKVFEKGPFYSSFDRFAKAPCRHGEAERAYTDAVNMCSRKIAEKILEGKLKPGINEFEYTQLVFIVANRVREKIHELCNCESNKLYSDYVLNGQASKEQIAKFGENLNNYIEQEFFLSPSSSLKSKANSTQ